MTRRIILFSLFNLVPWFFNDIFRLLLCYFHINDFPFFFDVVAQTANKKKNHSSLSSCTDAFSYIHYVDHLHSFHSCMDEFHSLHVVYDITGPFFTQMKYINITLYQSYSLLICLSVYTLYNHVVFEWLHHPRVHALALNALFIVAETILHFLPPIWILFSSWSPSSSSLLDIICSSALHSNRSRAVTDEHFLFASQGTGKK